MTCIYDAWSEALRIGHDQIQLKKEPILQQTMFDEYVHVDGDNVKAEKVIRSVRRDISDEAYLDVYYATLSAEEDALQAIYNFLRVGFAVGSKVLEQYSNPHVMRILELRRKVGNESHHFNEFARFQSLDRKVYVSHLEPKSDVIMLVGRHFADRMPSEHWMIIDDNRKTACVHPKDGTNYLRYLTDDEFESLRKTEQYEDEYTEMWKTFFQAVAIKERENYVCQRNLFPIWKRKHAVEFRHILYGNGIGEKQMTDTHISERYEFRNIKQNEAEEAAEIERICFPPNEACSKKHMKDRVAGIADLFLVAIDKENGKMAGFLNGLATDEVVLKDEFFTDAGLHNPEGKNIMLLGLDVLPEYRSQGLARELVRRYLEREWGRGRKEIILTCLESKVAMYEKFGFKDKGIAQSTWGGEEWHEMSTIKAVRGY